MNYEIVKLYTEHLNMSSFKNSFEGDNIESLAKFNTSIIPPNQGNLYTFLIEFTLRAVNNPIILDWRGVGILKYDGEDELTDDVLLDDVNIIEFVNQSIEKISFLLDAKLPDIISETKRNND